MKQAESYHIPDFFDCLWEKDLEDLLNNVKISTPKRSRPRSNKPVTSPISGPPGPAPLPTPPGPSPSQSGEEDTHSDGNREVDNGLEVTNGETIRDKEQPIIGELDVSGLRFSLHSTGTHSPIGGGNRYCHLPPQGGRIPNSKGELLEAQTQLHLSQNYSRQQIPSGSCE